MDDKLKNYYRWYESTYALDINLKKLEDKADEDQNKWLKRSVQHFQFNYSSIWRYEVLNSMRYYLFPRKTEYICTSFKITRDSKSSIISTSLDNIQYNTIYAMLYTYIDNDKIKFEFMSACPTFKSADGEYRHRFITVEQMFRTRNNNLAEFELVEEHILKQFKDKVINFETNHIFPRDITNKNIKDLNNEIEKNRLPILLYVSAWAIDFDRYMGKKMENHISEGYREAMFSIYDEKFHKDWTGSIEKEKLNIFMVDLTRFRKDAKQKVPLLELGQKFIPLTIYDVEATDNIKLTPWREVFIASLVGNLVINGITPSVPIFDDWFFIQGNSPAFWDNKVSHIKLDHSKIASDIVKKLEVARHGTYIIDPIKKKEMYLSFSMEGLSEAIDIPMDYAEQEIILADVILCTLTEHSGRTLADIPNLMMLEYYSRTYAGPLFKNYFVFSKFIFEFIYCMFCLNTKLGIVHSDIHLNNATLFIKRPFIDIYTGYSWIINSHVIYNVIKKYYIFPHHGSFSCVIDYSRAFVDRENLAKHFNNVDEIIYHQRMRMLRVFAREIPDFYNDNKDKIQIAILENFDTVYKIFMAIDPYKLTNGLIGLIKINVLGNKVHLEKYGDVDVISEQIILLEKINKISYNYITTNFNHLFNRKLNIDKLENINLIIINECFVNCELENFTPPLHNGEKFITLTDYFSSENEMKHDTRIYDKFPEAVKLDYIIKNKIPTDEIGLKNYEEYKIYLAKESIDKKIEKIQEEFIESKNERRGIVLDEKPEDIKKFKDEKKSINMFYYET